MNLEDNIDVVPATHHTDALNVLFTGSNGNYVANPAFGNREVVNASLPANSVVIGKYDDNGKSRVFYFVKSNTDSLIFIFYTITEQFVLLMSNTTHAATGETLLSFDPSYPIHSCNVIYRPDVDGDILCFTDNNGRPKYINIKNAATNNFYSLGWKASYITTATVIPLINPTAIYDNDALVPINNLKNKNYLWQHF